MIELEKPEKNIDSIENIIKYLGGFPIISSGNYFIDHYLREEGAIILNPKSNLATLLKGRIPNSNEIISRKKTNETKKNINQNKLEDRIQNQQIVIETPKLNYEPNIQNLNGYLYQRPKLPNILLKYQFPQIQQNFNYQKPIISKPNTDFKGYYRIKKVA